MAVPVATCIPAPAKAFLRRYVTANPAKAVSTLATRSSHGQPGTPPPLEPTVGGRASRAVVVGADVGAGATVDDVVGTTVDVVVVVDVDVDVDEVVLDESATIVVLVVVVGACVVVVGGVVVVVTLTLYAIFW